MDGLTTPITTATQSQQLTLWLNNQAWNNYDGNIRKVARGSPFLRNWRFHQAISQIRRAYLYDIGEPSNSTAVSIREIETLYFDRLDNSKQRGRF